MKLAGVVATLAVAASMVGACGSPTPTGTAGPDIKPIAASSLPAEILGLEVHGEDVQNTIARTENSYVKAVGLFSLRSGNLVQATLQVSDLTAKFNAKSATGRASLADKIGGSRSAPYRLGADTVYITQGTRQRVAVWFRGKGLYVLAVRDDYTHPRGLLRAVLELNA